MLSCLLSYNLSVGVQHQQKVDLTPTTVCFDIFHLVAVGLQIIAGGTQQLHSSLLKFHCVGSPFSQLCSANSGEITCTQNPINHFASIQDRLNLKAIKAVA